MIELTLVNFYNYLFYFIYSCFLLPATATATATATFYNGIQSDCVCFIGI